MSDLQTIAESYERIDSFLGDLRDSCDAAGDAGERDRVARAQELNDQAYFVLAWGQLETDIDEAFDMLGAAARRCRWTCCRMSLAGPAPPG